MTVSETLTNLGNAVRHIYLLTDKLGLDEMADLLAQPTILKDSLGPTVFRDGVSVTLDEGVPLLSTVKGGRVALNFSDGNPVGKVIAIYFQASTTVKDGVPIEIGPMSSGRAHFTIAGASMKGYYGTLNYTYNNSLSIRLPANSSIKIKDLRVWIVS